MLVSALVTFLVVILILYLINLLPLDGRAKQIIRVIVIILGVISLLEIHRGVLALTGIPNAKAPAGSRGFWLADRLRAISAS